MEKNKPCLSTHGGAGYSCGDDFIVYRYKDAPTINVRAEFVCGQCKFKGKANPTGGRSHYYSWKENIWKWLKNEEKFTEPTWPDWACHSYKYIERPL